MDNDAYKQLSSHYQDQIRDEAIRLAEKYHELGPDSYKQTQLRSVKLSSSDLQYFINESVNALTIFNEAVQANAKVGKDPFEGLSGKGEKLATAIVDKAYKVSVDAMNDKECIAFFKKNNPETIKLMNQVIKHKKHK